MDLITQTKTQEQELQTANIEFCKGIKKSNEDNYAKYVLKKEIVPITRWYVENIETKNQINLDLGDRLEHIELEQSFDFKNNYVGTIRSIVVELGPKHIKLATPEKYFYLMGENNKIFEIYKPLSKFENHLMSQKIQKITAIGILLFILILIIGGIMIF